MDEELRALLADILRIVQGLSAELERYRDLLPEPGSIKARMARRKVAATAVDRWNETS